MVGLDVVNQQLLGGCVFLDHGDGGVAQPDGFLAQGVVFVVFAEEVAGCVVEEAVGAVAEPRAAFDNALALAVVFVGVALAAGGGFGQPSAGIPGECCGAVADGVACGIVAVGFGAGAWHGEQAVAGGCGVVLVGGAI